MTFFKQYKLYKYIIYFIFLIACFLLFNQGDLAHTAFSSYAYLNGHFFNFYDYNKIYLSGNDYLPILYFFFAIWNIPLKLYNLVNEFSVSPGELKNILEMHLYEAIGLIWWKLFIVTAFFASVYLIHKISSAYINKVDNKSLAPSALLFATSPIAIFSSFIFSGYDIFSVFFSLFGFYFYLKKDYTKFSLLFSVAVGFKYFAFVIFVPLIIFAEKRVGYLIKYFLIALSLTFLQLIFYWHSDVFRDSFFSLATDKVSRAISHELYFVGLYACLCLILYFEKIKDRAYKDIIIFLIPIAAYACMFSSVFWHPQWLILLTPYFAFSYYFIKHKKIFFFVEILGALAFIWITVNIWPTNVDAEMVNRGALKHLMPQPLLNISDFLKPEYNFIFGKIFSFYLFFPILLICYEHFIHKKIKQPNYFNFEKFLMLRFLFGNSIFFVLALTCVFIPMSFAISINANAPFKPLNKEILAPTNLNQEIIAPQSHIAIGEIFGNKEVIQTFKASDNNFSGLMVMLATYMRTNDQPIKLILKSSDGKIIIEKIVSANDLKDNKYYGLIFPAQLNSKDKLYKLSIDSPTSFSGNAITAWATKNDSHPDRELTFAGNKLDGNLVMNLYYQFSSKTAK